MSIALRPIALGQRFYQFDGRNQDELVTVIGLDEDALGCSRIIFQAECGREIRAYAAQIEAAVAEGDLTPADDRFGVTILDRPALEQLAS